MRTTERNKLQRELTILQAKKRSGFGFTASDAERLSFLTDQLGNREQSMSRTQELGSDEPSVVAPSHEDELPEAELVDPTTLFDSVKDTDRDLPVLSLDDASPSIEPSVAGDLFNDAYSLDTPSPSSAEKEGQELLQSLFDNTATGSLDANGVLVKAESPPLNKPGSNATQAASPAPVALGKLRVVSHQIDGGPATEPARRELEPLPDIQFKGPRKAIVHFLDGVCHRGTIKQLDVSSDLIQLDPQPNGSVPAEEFPTDQLKAIFLLLPRGTPYPQKVGKPITVQLIDGRILKGTSRDYEVDCKAFTLLPVEDRGNIERVIVFRRGAKRIECAE